MGDIGLSIHFIVRTPKQEYMQNFSQIGEVPWPTLTQVLQSMPLNGPGNYWELREAGPREVTYSSWARHFTLTVPLSTQVYKWVPVNLMLGVTLRWTSIPGVSRNTPGSFHTTETGMSYVLMRHLARMTTWPRNVRNNPTACRGLARHCWST